MFKITMYRDQKETTTLDAHVALAMLVSGDCYVVFEGKIRDLEFMRSYVIADINMKLESMGWHFEFEGTKLFGYNKYHLDNGVVQETLDYKIMIEYGMKNGRYGIRETDVIVDESDIEEINSAYNQDDEFAPYLDFLDEDLWMSIFDGNTMRLPIC